MRLLHMPKHLLIRYVAKLLSPYIVIDPLRSEIDMDLTYPTALFPTIREISSEKRNQRNGQIQKEKSRFWCWGARIVLRRVHVHRDCLQRLGAKTGVIKFSDVSVDEILLDWAWSMDRTGNILGGWAASPELKICGLKAEANCVLVDEEDSDDRDCNDEYHRGDSDKDGQSDISENELNSLNHDDLSDSINKSSSANASASDTSAENKLKTDMNMNRKGVGKRTGIGRVWVGFMTTLRALLWFHLEQIVTFLTLEVSKIEISLQLPHSMSPSKPVSAEEENPISKSEVENQQQSRLGKETKIFRNRHPFKQKNQKRVIRVGKVSPKVIGLHWSKRQSRSATKSKKQRKDNGVKYPKQEMDNHNFVQTKRVREKLRRQHKRQSKLPSKEMGIHSNDLEDGEDILQSFVTIYVVCGHIFISPQKVPPRLTLELPNTNSRPWHPQGTDNQDNNSLDHINIGSLSIHVTEENSSCKGNYDTSGFSGCILRPFSYDAIAVHVAGPTFSNKSLAFRGRFDRNVVLVGQPISTYAESISNDDQEGILVHISEEQMALLGQLKALFLPSNAQESDVSSGIGTISVADKNNNTSPDKTSAHKPKISSIFWCAVPILSLELAVAEKIYIKTSKAKIEKNKLSTQASIQAVNIFIGKDKLDSEGLVRAYISCITTALYPKFHFLFHKIEALYAPGVMGLSAPLHKTCMYFDERKLCIQLMSACKVTLVDHKTNGQSHQKMDGDKNLESKMSEMKLPFPISAAIPSILVQKGDRVTELIDIKFEAKQTNVTLDGILFLVNFRKLRLDCLLQLTDTHISGMIDGKTPIDTVYDLHVEVGKAYAAKGFSFDDWDGIVFPKIWSDSSKPFWLPFANISAMKLRVCVKAGFIDNNDSILIIEEFTGMRKTTAKHVQNHYKKRALQNVPRFLVGVNIFGQNVSEVALQIAPFVHIGPIVGGVIVVLGIDGVKSAIKKGKKRRGVTSDDLYKPGDILRGVVSAKEEIESGELDVKVALVEYVQNNKPRLAGAAAGTLAFWGGSAAGGPVVGLIFAYFVSSATQRYFEKRKKARGEKEVVDIPCSNSDQFDFSGVY